MKTLIVALCALLGCAYAVVDEKAAEILKSEFDVIPEGGYKYAVETSNGISAQQNAVLKPSQFNKDEVALEVQGSSSYQSPNGEQIQLTYVADETGYHPQGNHLPTPPAPEPIPDYILRALEYIKEHPYEEKKIQKREGKIVFSGRVPDEVIRSIG